MRTPSTADHGVPPTDSDPRPEGSRADHGESDARGKTLPNVDGRSAPRMPHERDESSDSGTGAPSDLTFTVGTAALAHTVAELEKSKTEIGFGEIITDTNVVKVSAVGIGMRSNAGIAAKMFETLAERGINILAISTSEIKVSVLLPEDYTELAVRVLHTAFGLDAEQAA